MDRRIGAATDDFGATVKAALQHAARLGFGSVEIGTSSAEVNPRELTGSGRRHLARHVRDLGLSLAALAADHAGAGRPDAATIDARVNRGRVVLEMAADVGAPVVTARLGRLIGPASHQPADQAVEVLRNLGEQADRVGVLLAVRVGDDDPTRLVAMLEEMNCPSLRVCIDPAALLEADTDIASTVARMSKHIALSHARDARLTGGSGRLVETNLGRGDVDFTSYLATMEAFNYSGPHVIRRTETPKLIADLTQCKAYLGTLLDRRGKLA